MTKRKYDFTEELTDSNGVRRIYGYRSDGTAILVNVREVLSEYKARGLKGFEAVP